MFSLSRSPITSKVAASTVMGTFQQHAYHSLTTRNHQRRPCGRTGKSKSSTTACSDLRSAEDIFYEALARVSLCKHHARFHTIHIRPGSRGISSASRRRNVGSQFFNFSSQEGRKKPAHALAAAEVSQEELRSLVDVYDPYQKSLEDPKPRAATGDAVINVRRVKSKEEQEAQEQQPLRHVWKADEHVQQAIMKLNQLLDDTLVPHSILFDAYHALPAPRVAYLTDETIHSLFKHLRVVEYKNETSMLRYFCLMDDMTTAGIPPDRASWNSAIAFAGRWVRKVQEHQVETAMQIWLRMEREAGITADNVTFNILFDVATKAGKFALAEVILREMEDREMNATRFLRVGKIYFYGLKRDGEAVRRSYKELVNSGDFVDTAVLNCVIASLIRAGEASAAEFIFERMKRMSDEKKGARPAPRGWRGQRDLATLLMNAAHQLRLDPEGRGPIQDATPVTPNLHTYRILIRYHALEAGNIDRMTELIYELQAVGLDLHGSIFYHVFRGFREHGGVRYSSWTKNRLDKWWMVFLAQVEQYREVNETNDESVSSDERGSYIDLGIAIAALRAYEKCAGKEAVLGVWGEILERWTPEKRDLEIVNETLAQMGLDRFLDEPSLDETQG